MSGGEVIAPPMDSADSADQASKTAYSDFARCIVPLLDSLRWRGDKTHLAEALPHFPENMEMVELLNTMASLKFESRMVPARLDRIDSRQMPCLFVPDNGPAKVLVGPMASDLLAYDGGLGTYIQLKPTAVTGTAVLFTVMRDNADSFLKPQANWLQKLLGRFKSIFVQGLLLSLVLSIFAMLTPAMIMLVYDRALGAGSLGTLGWVALGMAIFVLADAGFRLLRSYLFQYVSVRLGNLIGNEVLRRLLFLPPALTEVSNLGAQVSRIRDFENIREFFAGMAVISLFDLPFILLLLLTLIIMAGNLAFVPLAGIGLFVVFGLAMRPVIQRTNALAAQTGSERQAFVVEMLSNMRAIRQASGADTWLERYRKLSADAADAGFQVNRVNAVVNAFSYVLVMGCATATMSVGVFRVFGGEMTAGGLIGSMALVWRVLAPLGTGFGVLTQVGRIGKSVEQVDRLMSMRLESRDEAVSALSGAVKGKISFSNASIRYSADAPPALIGINFSADPGDVTAIVGHDGAGKTTVLKLILGLYSPQAGRIFIDDMNLRQLDPILLRRRIAYIPKGQHFFHGTIAQNLRLANLGASDEELYEACRKAGVLDAVLAMPRGLETRIGDHNISQVPVAVRKRLSLARTFLRNARIILIDEPESGLSDEEEDDFIKALSVMRESASVVVATHSEKLLSQADNILWLEGGRVRKWGKPEAVMRDFATLRK